MRAICKHLSIVAATGGDGIDVYRDIVKPVDYDFGLQAGGEYLVFGVSFRRASVWLYIAHDPSAAVPDISLAPAALFSFDTRDLPEGMALAVAANGGDAEIIPAAVASFDRWFERYVDEDPDVVRTVRDEVTRLSR